MVDRTAKEVKELLAYEAGVIQGWLDLEITSDIKEEISVARCLYVNMCGGSWHYSYCSEEQAEGTKRKVLDQATKQVKRIERLERKVKRMCVEAGLEESDEKENASRVN